MNPKISIIIPVYNVEQYLPRCIDSILAQTFTNFELILIDDGSTDSSGKICDKYSEKDSRVKVIHKENGGLSSARNVGLGNAAGKYISFIDSDDYVSSDYLEYLHSLIKKYDADVVSANYILTYSNKVNFISRKKEQLIIGKEKILFFYLKQDKMNKKNDFPVWIKLYKKELFDGIQFPSGKLYEDNITNFKIFQKCERYAKSSKIVYAYFQRRKSITKSKLSQKHLALIDSSKEMLELAGNDKKIAKLCRRKIAMSYFSILAMYVRYGTDLSEEKINGLVNEYKEIKHNYLKTEKSMKIHIISFLMCRNIQALRKLYLKLGRTV